MRGDSKVSVHVVAFRQLTSPATTNNTAPNPVIFFANPDLPGCYFTSSEVFDRGLEKIESAAGTIEEEAGDGRYVLNRLAHSWC
jgi:hypothetical protein